MGRSHCLGMHSFLSFLCVFLACALSESSIKIAVEFGQNVTLNCSVAKKEVFWFIQRKAEPPVYILRTFTYNTPPMYNRQHQEFKQKYSLKDSNRLVIHNVTRNELQSYYCGELGNRPIFSNVTTVIEKANAAVTNQHIVVNEEDYVKSWMFPSFVVSCFLSGVFSVLLLVAVIRHCTKEKRNTSLVELHQPESPVYSDIIPSTATRPIQIQCTASPYAIVRLPSPGRHTPRVTAHINTDRNQV